MFRRLVIAVITAWAAILETVADAIVATLPPPAADSPRLRVVAPGKLCLRLLIVSPAPCQPRPGAARSAAAPPHARHGDPISPRRPVSLRIVLPASSSALAGARCSRRSRTGARANPHPLTSPQTTHRHLG